MVFESLQGVNFTPGNSSNMLLIYRDATEIADDIKFI